MVDVPALTSCSPGVLDIHPRDAGTGDPVVMKMDVGNVPTAGAGEGQPDGVGVGVADLDVTNRPRWRLQVEPSSPAVPHLDPFEQRAIRVRESNPLASVAIDNECGHPDVPAGAGSVLIATCEIQTVTPHCIRPGVLHYDVRDAVKSEGVLELKIHQIRAKLFPLTGDRVGASTPHPFQGYVFPPHPPPVGVCFRVSKFRWAQLE